MIDIKERIRKREFRWALGQRIKAARERSGLEQAELARALGLSQSAISRLECGQSDVSVWQLVCIAEVVQFAVKNMIPPR